MERKIYSGWAFSDNEREKAKINHELYQELKEKAVLVYREEQATKEMLANKSVVCYWGSGYGNTKYKVLSNVNKLTNLELALVCDSGNLCFGYRNEGWMIVIHVD